MKKVLKMSKTSLLINRNISRTSTRRVLTSLNSSFVLGSRLNKNTKIDICNLNLQGVVIIHIIKCCAALSKLKSGCSVKYLFLLLILQLSISEIRFSIRAQAFSTIFFIIAVSAFEKDNIIVFKCQNMGAKPV